jgi:hypothetical protein
MFCKSLFVLLYFFFWPLCCLFFFDIRRFSNTNPTKIGVELRCSGRVSSSCSTSDTRRVNLVTNPVISHEWGKLSKWWLQLNQEEPLIKLFPELLTPLEHLSSPPDFSRVRITRSLAICVWFVDHCLSFCTFSFGHCVVCSSIYRFWSPNSS